MTRLGSLVDRTVYSDTNVFIYALKSFAPMVALLHPLFEMVCAGYVRAVTSELTLAEVLVKPMREGNLAAQQICQHMLSDTPGLRLIPVTRQILVESARLRASTSLKLPDALHVATALLVGCDRMLTNDTRFRLFHASIEVTLLADLVP